MRRRAVVCIVCAIAVGMAMPVLAQPSPRVAVLALADIPYATDALVDGLRDLGYVDGKTMALTYRSARGDERALPPLAEALVKGDPEVLVAMGAAAARALRQATATKPIVMAPVGSPVAAGFAKSLSHPGGNMTGVSIVSLDLAAKRVAIAKELLPGAKRVAVFMTTSNSAPQPVVDASKRAGREAGVDVEFIVVAAPNDLEAAFADALKRRAEAIVVSPSPLFNSERPHLAQLALAHHIALIGEAREFATAGFVVGYGPSLADATRHAAPYIDKILKGAKPADLPIEQPTSVELTVNLAAAKQLGIVVPPSLLARADEVIR